MVIYDGFDFGFNHSESVPSSPSSISGSEPGTPESPGAEWGGSVTPRPRQTRDGADYFMKRGDWKRRGIVFTACETPMASEDECFDLEV